MYSSKLVQILSPIDQISEDNSLCYS